MVVIGFWELWQSGMLEIFLVSEGQSHSGVVPAYQEYLLTLNYSSSLSTCKIWLMALSSFIKLFEISGNEIHYMKACSFPLCVSCPCFPSLYKTVCPLCAPWSEFLSYNHKSELGQRPPNPWSSFELCYLMLKWSWAWVGTKYLLLFLKHMDFCVWFLSAQLLWILCG